MSSHLVAANQAMTVPVRLSYLVCATPRSGSGLLCGGLMATARAGYPDEFFSPTHVHRFMGDWGIRSDESTPSTPRTQPGVDYLQAVWVHASLGGVVGIKIHWYQLEWAIQRGLVEFDALFRGPPGSRPSRLIFLRRADTLGQAISLLIAAATHVYYDGNLTKRVAKASSSGTNYTTKYTYNDGDQLTKVTDPVSRIYKFWYCNCGRLKAVQYPNGTFSWNDVNAVHAVSAVYNRHGTLPATLPSSVPTDASPIVDYAYTYNLDGKKTQEVRSGGGLTTETTSYQYDNLGRLSHVDLPGSISRDYNYDLDSNRTSIVENSVTVATYTYDANVLDELTSATAGGTTSYTYTNDGQAKTRGSDVINWDGRGRHYGGTFGGNAVDYSFDATGFRRQRVAGGVTKHYRLGGLFYTDASATINGTWVDTTFGNLAFFSGPPTTGSTVSYTYYNDHGDLAAEANSSGARPVAYTYDAFGSLRPPTTLPANIAAQAWLGAHDKKFDTTSSLMEMGVRTYDPAIGRFLSLDPIEGGSLNGYDYALQDPLNTFDLDGTIGYASS